MESQTQAEAQVLDYVKKERVVMIPEIEAVFEINTYTAKNILDTLTIMGDIKRFTKKIGKKTYYIYVKMEGLK